MPKPFLITLTGPSGVGKESLGKHLVSVRPRFQLSVSTTTRLRRPGEIQGRDYFFVTREEFEREAILNQFLEWAQYADHLYGTPRNEIQRAMQAGKTLVAIVEVKGAKLIKARVPATWVSLSLLPSPHLRLCGGALRNAVRNPKRPLLSFCSRYNGKTADTGRLMAHVAIIRKYLC